MNLILALVFSGSVLMAKDFDFLHLNPLPKQIGVLSTIRDSYISEKWELCFTQSVKHNQHDSLYQEWLQEFALRCARGDYVESKKTKLIDRWLSLYGKQLPLDGLVWTELKNHWLALLQLMEKDKAPDLAKWALWFSINFDLNYEQNQWIQGLIDKSKPAPLLIKKFYFEPENEINLFQLWQVSSKWDSGVEYLLSFPGGQFVDKIEQGLYLQLLKNPALEFKNLDLPILERLMRRAHRSGDYDLAQVMAQSILTRYPTHADAFFISGRSHYFTGNYFAAEKQFQKLIQLYPKYVESEDVVSRLGFALIRQENWLAARVHWEKILRSNPGPNLELVARYWLLVIGQKIDKQYKESKAYFTDLEALTQRFPYSFYALKLSGVRVGPASIIKDHQKSQKCPILPRDEKKWKMMVYLAKSGWWDEAFKIYRGLMLPQDPDCKELLIDYFKKIEFTPALSPLVNEWLNGSRLLDQATLNSIYPRPYHEEINQFATLNRLNPVLVWSLIRQESIFLSQIESSAQAVGLMQMIPATANEVARALDYKLRDWSFEGRLAKLNIRMGTQYLQNLILQFDQNEPLALAAYNYGPTRLKVWLKGRKNIFMSQDPLLKDLWIEELPAQETQFYVKAIERNRIIYQFILDSGPNKK